MLRLQLYLCVLSRKIDLCKTTIFQITGSNTGLGYGIVKNLCQNFKGIVYLTAQNTQHGHEAVDKLKKEGYAPEFHQLDITSDESVQQCETFLMDNHDGLDLLINNAGISKVIL